MWTKGADLASASLKTGEKVLNLQVGAQISLATEHIRYLTIIREDYLLQRVQNWFQECCLRRE